MPEAPLSGITEEARQPAFETAFEAADTVSANSKDAIPATPAEAIEAALREHLVLRLTPSAIEQAQRGHPLWLSGAQAEDAARIAVDALKAAALLPDEGQVVVSAAYIVVALTSPIELDKAQDLADHIHARDELLAAARAALPERKIS